MIESFKREFSPLQPAVVLVNAGALAIMVVIFFGLVRHRARKRLD